MGVFSGATKLGGGFYEGGADQADFDAWVLAQRRKLGVMPDRGANGTCRPVANEAYNPSIFQLDIEFSTSACRR